MKDNILITGGLGYVGGRASQKLSESSICNVLLGTRRMDCETPRWLDKAVIIRMDLLSEDSLSEACKNVRYIIHLAALNKTECADDPEVAVRVNTLGTLKLLKAAERAGVERFIYMSTAHIYKSPLIGTITEDTLPRPLHPYAITHKAAEDFVFASHDRKRLVGIVVRLSNGFGVPAHKDVNCWTLLANDLCRQAATTGKLVLKSAGLQRRDFITLTDVGRALR